MNVDHGGLRQGKTRRVQIIFELFISLHLGAFQFISVQAYRISNPSYSENGQDLLIQYSERSDLYNPCPEGLLAGIRKKCTFFHFFCPEHPLWRLLLYLGVMILAVT